MTPKILDALLLDRAAGALPDDVAQLLDAYLAEYPEAAIRGLRYSATIDLIRAAMPPAAKQAGLRVPPFPARRVEAARKRRRWLATLQPLAIAAGIALAFVLGNRFATQPERLDTISLVSADAAQRGGFWAYSAVSAAPSARNVPASTVRWSSPLRWPQPGGAS